MLCLCRGPGKTDVADSDATVRLLFDRNLSPQLKRILSDLYPQSLHVADLEMETAADTVIWEYASARGLVVVTKDADYRDLSISRGHPPKVVLIRSGNCPTMEVAALLRERYDDLLAFYQDEQAAFVGLP